MRPVDGAAMANVPLSRRGMLAGAAATGAGAALAFGAGSAEATEVTAKPYLPKVRHYLKTPLPDSKTLHMSNRFANGYTPKLRKKMHDAGGALHWFEEQLHPTKIADPVGHSFGDWWVTRNRTPTQHFQHADMESGYFTETVLNHGRWTILRRAYSSRQLLEVMSEFWLNHLHIYNAADIAFVYRTDYDNLIRSHALGRYDEMLQEAIVHPCMLTYLDGDLSMIDRRRSGAPVEKLNENLGRELLELHTVGREEGYSEAEVVDSARILTGYHIDRFDTWKYSYDPDRHYTGAVKVLGFRSANTSLDGRAVLHDYLQYLAHHPATAQRIARKLAVRFVSDNPSEELVNHLADVFTESGTDIKTTIRALVHHPDFFASAGDKIRTPNEDIVACLRKLGVHVNRPVNQSDAANMLYYVAKSVGQVPFGWPRPDGFPDVGEVWSSAGRMMGSFRMHYTMSGGYWPSRGARYRRASSWLPEKHMRFDAFVDHLCRTLHGESSSSILLGAASIAVDVHPAEVITADHILIRYRMAKLLGILLDTQKHLTR